MKKLSDILVIWFSLFLLIIIKSVLLSVFIMLLWNWLVPVIFGFAAISWIQAFGLTILFSLFFSTVSVKNDKEN